VASGFYFEAGWNDIVLGEMFRERLRKAEEVCAQAEEWARAFEAYRTMSVDEMFAKECKKGFVMNDASEKLAATIAAWRKGGA
jgi:hypothetical protein